jgi:hypothetical protein
MKTFAKWPFYLFLLPAFFMLHGLMENYVPGLAGTAIEQNLLFTGAGILLTLLFRLLLRDTRKAALVSCFLLTFNFIYGSYQDWLRAEIGWNTLPTRYSFNISLLLVLATVLVIYLKRSKQLFLKITLFLNLLFTILILLDIVSLFPKVINQSRYGTPDLSRQVVACDTCSRPDVYVIVPDEYAGKQELEDIFSFDNSAFENELANRGFRVIGNTTSNYNATVYSLASLFGMHYPELTANHLVTQRDMLLCRNIINQNNTTRFFESKGYSFTNNSFFDFNGIEKAVTKYYFVSKRMLFTSQTFIERFLKEASFNFFSKKTIQRLETYDLVNDRTVDSLTRQTALSRSKEPKFVYCHFTMPHHPYFFDRNGQPFHFSDSVGFYDRLRIQYTEYLQYTNKKLLSLIDHIKQHSARPPVILLASDHGFRQFYRKTDRKYYFMNFMAVHLPSGNYDGFYDGITPVNMFRQILNAQFSQRLPLLRDSTSFILEK